MGECFIVYNINRQESAKPGFANWKVGEFNFEKIIDILNWSKTDSILAYGNNGTIINYNQIPHNTVDLSGYKSRYVWDDKEIQSELSIADMLLKRFRSQDQTQVTESAATSTTSIYPKHMTKRSRYNIFVMELIVHLEGIVPKNQRFQVLGKTWHSLSENDKKIFNSLADICNNCRYTDSLLKKEPSVEIVQTIEKSVILLFEELNITPDSFESDEGFNANLRFSDLFRKIILRRIVLSNIVSDPTNRIEELQEKFKLLELRVNELYYMPDRKGMLDAKKSFANTLSGGAGDESTHTRNDLSGEKINEKELDPDHIQAIEYTFTVLANIYDPEDNQQIFDRFKVILIRQLLTLDSTSIIQRMEERVTKLEKVLDELEAC